MSIVDPTHWKTLYNRHENILPPGPGNQLVITVPPHEMWELISFTASFTADANVGNRLFNLQYHTPEGNCLWRRYYTRAATAGDTLNYCHFQGAADFQYITQLYYISWSLPVKIFLREGDQILFTAAGIQVGDIFTDINLYINRWLRIREKP